MTAREFGELLEKRVDPFTVMLLILSGEKPAADGVIASATGSLLHTGQRQLLVTNHHVYASFESHLRSSPDTVLAMSGVDGSFFLDITAAPVLGLDKQCDLVVLDVPPEQVLAQGKMWSEVTRWPPRRPEKGTIAILYGYPGEGRAPEGKVLGASPISVGLPVVSVSERHFVLADENQNAHLHKPDAQIPLTNFGGISGSAVYVLPKTLANIDDAIGLCGFVYEASDSGVILVSHADHINADGSIR
jgi:hypothetical protein